jgi:hypothetical protein
VFFGADAHPDRHPLAGVANGLHELIEKPLPVPPFTAVHVGPLVGDGGQELMAEKAVGGVDFDHVEAAQDRELAAVGELQPLTLDLGNRQCAGHGPRHLHAGPDVTAHDLSQAVEGLLPGDFIGQAGRRSRRQGVSVIGGRLATQSRRHLGAGPGTKVVDPLGIQRRAELVARMEHHHASSHGKFGRQPGTEDDTADDQGGPAFGSGADIGQPLLRNLAVRAAHEVLHGCDGDSILQLHTAHLDR